MKYCLLFTKSVRPELLPLFLQQSKSGISESESPALDLFLRNYHELPVLSLSFREIPTNFVNLADQALCLEQQCVLSLHDTACHDIQLTESKSLNPPPHPSQVTPRVEDFKVKKLAHLPAAHTGYYCCTQVGAGAAPARGSRGHSREGGDVVGAPITRAQVLKERFTDDIFVDVDQTDFLRSNFFEFSLSIIRSY